MATTTSTRRPWLVNVYVEGTDGYVVHTVYAFSKKEAEEIATRATHNARDGKAFATERRTDSAGAAHGARKFPLARELLARTSSDLVRAVLCSMAAELLEEQINHRPTDEELAAYLSEAFEEYAE